jgi:hypothetical protein
MMRLRRPLPLVLSLLASTTLIGCWNDETAPHPVSLPADAAADAKADAATDATDENKTPENDSASDSSSQPDDGLSDVESSDGGTRDASDDGD